MAESIVKKKARNRTSAQRSAAKHYGEQFLKRCRGCSNRIPIASDFPFCAFACAQQAGRTPRFKKTCSTCMEDEFVSLEIHLEVLPFTCNNCTEKAKKEVEKRAYRKRRQQLKLATPKSVDRDAIRNIYEQCRLKSKATGIPHEVDHEVPIISDVVCGLNVPVNLRIIPAQENRKKHNRFDT